MVAVMLLAGLAVLAGCEDDVNRSELEVFPGTYQYTAFSVDGPAVTLNGTLEISGLLASRGTATLQLDAQGQWAGSAIRLESAAGTTAFLEAGGAIFVQEEGSAFVGAGATSPVAFEMSHTGQLEEGEIRGTFTLQVEGLGSTGGEFTATR